ncbi:MAG: EAL domain-containing protein [Kiloniellales bacterium]|nr:EAL domain-containing protein [Kiloniellales bacterium]
MLRSSEPRESHSELVRFRAAIEASGDILYEWDLATDELRLLGATAGLFGRDGAQVPATGEALNERIDPEDMPARMRALSEHIAGRGHYDCEYRLHGDDHEPQWIHDRGAVEVSATGAPQRLIGVLRLITQRKQHEAQLEYQASFDELTGHFNKVRLREALDQALAQSLRYDQNGAFLVIGLDQMGMINTAYGYEAGDAILFEVSQRLDRCLRATDVIGRLGGDRFGVLVSCCSESQARVTAERILRAVRQTPIEIGGKQVHVTASASVVVFPSQSKTSFDVMAKAEGALLQAKLAGRDCIQWYEMSEEQRLGFQTSMDIGEQVKLALKEGRLSFAYQPIVDAGRGTVRLFECLLRMRAPDGEIVAANRFVPVIEQLGLMRTVDRHALEMAVDDLERHPGVRLAVNISGLTAADRSWLRVLVARLKHRREIAERLVIEITETAAMFDIEETARFVTAVRELGCQVAVDDFGAGYTTFRHLKSLTVDLVKIDGSFVKAIHHSTENQLFIRNLLSLAKSFGLETVAECVQTAEEAAYLAKEGVELLQGHFFGEPTLEPPWKAERPAGEVATGATLRREGEERPRRVAN